MKKIIIATTLFATFALGGCYKADEVVSDNTQPKVARVVPAEAPAPIPETIPTFVPSSEPLAVPAETEKVVAMTPVEPSRPVEHSHPVEHHHKPSKKVVHHHIHHHHHH